MLVQNLSDKQLHNNLLNFTSSESTIIAKTIIHLEEVHRRRLFSEFGCSSVYQYCTKILKLSNGDAHRKVSACKLVGAVPGVADAIAAGELNISNASIAQSFLNKHEEIEAAEVVSRIKDKSTKECEAELEAIAIENDIDIPKKKPSRRRSGEDTKLSLYINSEKLELIKAKLGIKCDQDLLNFLIDEKLDVPVAEVKAKKHKENTKARSLSPSKKAAVYKAAQNKCQLCESKFHLQIDHVQSVAHGGTNDLEILRLLCRPCNQRAAISQMGFEFMDEHINARRPR